MVRKGINQLTVKKLLQKISPRKEENISDAWYVNTVTTYLFPWRNISDMFMDVVLYHTDVLIVTSSSLLKQGCSCIHPYTLKKNLSSVNIVGDVSVTDSLLRIICTHMTKVRKCLNAETAGKNLEQEEVMRAIVLAIAKLHVCVICVVREWSTPGVCGCTGWHTLIPVSSEDIVVQYVGKLVETGELCASCVMEKWFANFSLWPSMNTSVSVRQPLKYVLFPWIHRRKE